MTQSKNEKRLSSSEKVAQGILTGSVAGATEVAYNHPLWVSKTRAQTLQMFSLNPRILYKGILPNMASMIPITAVQVGLNAYIQSFSKNSTLSNVEKVGSAFAAGVGSATISCPIEMIMTHQGLMGMKFSDSGKYLLNNSGWKSFYTALPATGMREGLFTSFFLVGIPYFTAKFQSYYPNGHLPTVFGGIVAGVCAAVLTQPFDTIKTAQQAITIQKPISFNEAVKKIYSRGPRGFFAGGFWRGLRVVSAINIMGKVNDTMTEKFQQYHSPDRYDIDEQKASGFKK